MSKSQDDKIMIDKAMVIEKGSTLLLSSDRRFSNEALEAVYEKTGCRIVSLEGVRLLGVIPPG